MNTPGERIKHARELRGWSRNRLDAEARLSQGSTSRLERNERAGMGDTIAKVAAALGVRADWLLSGTTPMEAEAVPVQDAVPRRAEAARLAREDGVYEGAIVAVLAERPDAHALSRSVLWWTDRMRMRQAELLGAVREAPAAVGGRAPEGSGIRPSSPQKK